MALVFMPDDLCNILRYMNRSSFETLKMQPKPRDIYQFAEEIPALTKLSLPITCTFGQGYIPKPLLKLNGRGLVYSQGHTFDCSFP